MKSQYMTHLDMYDRPINYLRISVTDRCNLRCVYCMPPEGVPWRPHDLILSYEEIELIVHAAAELGINKVRLTGGEPLVRLGIVDLVQRLAAVPGIDELTMTTNGVLLSRYADDLARAGLRRVNVSLDTLRPERFHAVTRLGKIEDVLAGMDAAHRAGLRPVKINAVILRGMNDDEVVEFAQRTVAEEWHVRFIEWMPVGSEQLAGQSWNAGVVTADEMRSKIEAQLGQLLPAKTTTGNGPARYYRLPGAVGTIGFITPVSDHFCFQCNRLRLTADGQLRPCLLSDAEIDLRRALRQGADVAQIKGLIFQAIRSKPLQHHLDECQHPGRRVMSQIGG
jgi:cyclic pyranopterin phosphate synthase